MLHHKLVFALFFLEKMHQSFESLNLRSLCKVKNQDLLEIKQFFLFVVDINVFCSLTKIVKNYSKKLKTKIRSIIFSAELRSIMNSFTASRQA